MKINAEIICRRTPYGMVCDWKGPRAGIAKIYAEQVTSLSREPGHRKLQGGVFEVGRLKLRVVQFPVLESGSGNYCDTAAVMLESSHAELYWLYRRNAERLVRLFLNLEARVRGFMLKPVYGEVMPFTKSIADKLL